MAHMKAKDGTGSPVFSSWHVGVAAEAIAAALFARCGFDISIQYGANQPEYDLIVSHAGDLLKVSVKGSQDGGWGLAQGDIQKGSANYHAAADEWLARHKSRTILCFVQFKDVPLTDMPRVYLATPEEVAERLKASAKGRGDTVLWEKHAWAMGSFGAGTEDAVPTNWQFSKERVIELLRWADS